MSYDEKRAYEAVAPERSPAIPDAFEQLAKAVEVLDRQVDELVGRLTLLTDQHDHPPAEREPTLVSARGGSSALCLQMYEQTDRIEAIGRRLGHIRGRLET